MSDEWVWFEYRWKVPKALMQEKEFDEKIGGPRFLTIKNGLQYRWCIWLYPDDQMIHHHLYTHDRASMSFVLWLDKGSIQSEVKAKYKLQIVGREEQKQCGPTTLTCPSDTEPERGFQGLRQEGLYPYEDLDEVGTATMVEIRVRMAVQKCAFDHRHLFPSPPLNFSRNGLAKFQQIVLGHPTECQDEGVVILVAETERISCHQAVLDQASPVFQRMFAWTNTESQTKEVAIPDVSARTLKQLLFFFYVGSLPKGWDDNALALLYAAHKYDVKGLPQLCEKAAAEQLSLETAMEALKMGKGMGLGLLEMKAAHFLLDHWKELPDAEKEELNASRALGDIANAKKAIEIFP